MLRKIRNEGLGTILSRRLDWYRGRFQIDNPIVGRVVELAGDKVRMDGMTFSVASPNITTGHKSTLAFGLHEMEERALVKAWLPRDIPAIELGGGLGVVSCLTNRLLADPARHVVVEANPRMVPVLTRNRDLNKCRFEVVNKAIAYDAATIEMPIDPGFVGSNLAAIGESSGSETVATTTLTRLIDEAGFDAISLISDIEGAEEQVILREIPRLGERVRFAMMELHPYVLGDDAVAALMARMAEAGFRLLERKGEGAVFSVAYGR